MGLFVRYSRLAAQRYAPLHESGLIDLGLGYPLLRQILRELGRRLAKRSVIPEVDDIFGIIKEEVNQASADMEKGNTVCSIPYVT